MENTIRVDRKEYRRTSGNGVSESRIKSNKAMEVNAKNNSSLLGKIINVMLILLSILLLKFFGFDDKFDYLKEYFNSGLEYEQISNYCILKFTEKNNVASGENELRIDIVSGENIFGSGETVSGDGYITAVEGVNQFLDDANFIKNNFQIVSPLNGIITSKFGCRTSDSKIVSSYHAGIDIGATSGTLFVSAHDGEVIQAGENGTYGKSIMIENENLITVYAHCSEILVKKGDKVTKGQNIGKVGMTGNATGPHLHFEIRFEGRLVNPEDII